MAYVIGSEKNIKTEAVDLQAYGLLFPITTEFKVSYNVIEQIKTNLINLLRTIPGERVMQPNFGCNLVRLLFEPNTDLLNEKIQDEIESTIEFWMPFLTITEIIIESTDTDRDFNRMFVHLKFTIDGDSTIQEITFPVVQYPTN